LLSKITFSFFQVHPGRKQRAREDDIPHQVGRFGLIGVGVVVVSLGISFCIGFNGVSIGFFGGFGFRL